MLLMLIPQRELLYQAQEFPLTCSIVAYGGPDPWRPEVTRPRGRRPPRGVARCLSTATCPLDLSQNWPRQQNLWVSSGYAGLGPRRRGISESIRQTSTACSGRHRDGGSDRGGDAAQRGGESGGAVRR